MPFILAAFTWFRSTWIGRALAIAGGVLIAVLLVFAAGKRSQRRDQRVEDMEFGEDIRERAHEAKERAWRDTSDMSHDDIVERLRAKGRLRD